MNNIKIDNAVKSIFLQCLSDPESLFEIKKILSQDNYNFVEQNNCILNQEKNEIKKTSIKEMDFNILEKK